ncbi:two-component system nitrogen regulation sensor histidine kinase GlnL [Sphingobium sp. B2D3A]|uniref:two-component system sensor histidine kinase NtrB n=1 Tax=unclassified Sphingobium TaxID=2611147 RepID=UPI00222443F2|nr:MULTISPECIES: ATP-binding protein [unclassified Sphingobium]MCW2338017.1 two-component system nitrogen regulation sensor histidine kinase GlnL [Sphingobium sp. B2D3A]MCW2384476.1 two-component system nitrogen regulation sensor histidine kinase GlnL [Sphingobium sp. B2D3D]
MQPEADFRAGADANAPTRSLPAAAEIVSAHPVATLMIDPDGRIVMANARAETLLNMARSALVGSAIGRVLRIADPRVDAAIWMTDKPLSAYDIQVHAGRNEALEMDILIHPLLEDDRWRIVALHVHGQSQALGTRRTSMGVRSATGAAAMLAHEIKNPLSGIRGAAQLLEGDAGEATRPLTKLICDEVDRIAALIDRMQHFTSNQPLECRPENIYPLLDRAVELACAGFARNCTITRTYDPSLPFAQVNGDALVQIMLNLVKNAVEAVDGMADGAVQVATAYRHGLSVMGARGKGAAPLQIEIQVIDNGPGVPDNIRDVLFNPFISNKRSGQGLGLALVDKLVRDMNGLVQYERDKVAGRSIFRVLLPMGGSL